MIRACVQYTCVNVDEGGGGLKVGFREGIHQQDRDAINYPSMRIFFRKVYACVSPSPPFLSPPPSFLSLRPA